ncbi:MAG: hypothetical protein EAZ61_08520 [Oscillatoriales cyanobacterium]|nr:MAG: hypothetical protein EAZ61_08520 [Oscillatoriales cyanobacterium]
MNRPRILQSGQPKTFSQYFDLPYPLSDILTEFNCTLNRQTINLPRQPYPVPIDPLQRQLQRNRDHIELINETARREALIAPILFEIADLADRRIYLEYAIDVSEHLRGVLDYYIASPDGSPAHHNLAIIEAKQSDLMRGFTQLAIELIALDQWTTASTPLLYGIVTTGEDWQFGTFDRRDRIVTQDPKRYVIPAELESLLEILLGITQFTEH